MMEYVTKCHQPFHGVISRLEEALRLRGYAARRSFDLGHSAAQSVGDTSYSVLMIDTTDKGKDPQMIVAHSTAGRLVLTLPLTPAGAGLHDLRSMLADILVEMGCCSWEEPRLDVSVTDPVCGMVLDREDAHAMVEREGRKAYLCCSLCQQAFERDPDRYQ